MRVRYNNFIVTAWDRILYNAKVMNFAKDKKFLRKLIYSGKICTEHTTIDKYNIGEIGRSNKNRFRELYYRRLCDYIDSYQNKFGDDWDIHFQKDTNTESDYYSIHLFKIFDTVVVNNYTKGTSHTIKDLAVFNTIGMKSSGDFWVPRMQGLRLTFSKKEVKTYYVHSHLKTNKFIRSSPDDLTSFCVGADSDVSLLSGMLATNFSKEQFELLLYAQDSTMECESTIGAPYIRFATLLDEGSISTVTIDLREMYEDHIRDLLLSSCGPIDVNYYISNNEYRIKNDDVFSAFIKNQVINNLEELYWGRFICKKNEDGFYYSYRDIKNISGSSDNIEIHKDDTDNDVPYIYYKGVKREFKINKENIKKRDELKIEEFIVYPNLLNYIHGELEHKLQETAIAGSNIRRYYSSNNATTYLR